MAEVGVADWQQAGFGLYVHWPFCESKCPYCDFNSHVAKTVDHGAWRTAFLAELRRYAELTPGRVLRSIFFGGGTPSLMEPETVAAVISEATALWFPANDIEITLEANPGSVEAGRFVAYRAAGVNRVSLGIQALNDTDLRRLGRKHSLDEAMRALQIARKEFSRVSFDLIYARQDQSLAAWQDELKRALDLAAGHLSLYQLTIEDGTVFAERMARGLLHGLPEEDLAADFYHLTQEICESAGMPAYEISNHAAPGQQSIHNLIYWQGGDYVGIGPGAHGRLTLASGRHPTEAPRAPGEWLQRASNPSGPGQDIQPALAWDERAIEYLLMGLRIRQGISMARLDAMLGREAARSEIAALRDMGMVTMQDDALAVTDSGRPLLNAILQRIVNAI